MNTVPTLYDNALLDPDRWFSDMLTSLIPTEARATRKMFLDVKDSGDKYVVEAALPGVKRDAVDISFERGQLRINVTSASENKEQNERYLLREIRKSALERVIALPEDVEPESISATLQDGVLQITVDKKDKPKPIKIQVQ